MKKRNYLSSVLQSVCLSAALLASSFGLSAWDEVGPKVKGQRYNFSDTYVQTEVTTPVKQNGLWGFVNKDGKVTIKPKYQEIGEPQYYKNIPGFGSEILDKALIPVKLNGLWGFVGQNGKEIIKPQYEYVGEFFTEETRDNIGNYEYNGKCIVSKGGRYFYINQKGKEKGSLGPGLTEVFDVNGVTYGIDRGSLTVLNGEEAANIVKEYPNMIYFEYSGSKLLRPKKGEKGFYSVEDIMGPADRGVAVIKNNNGTYVLMDYTNTGKFLSFPPFKKYITFTEAADGSAKYYGLYGTDNTFTAVSAGNKQKAFSTDKVIKGWFGDRYFRFYEPGDTTKCGIMNAFGEIVAPAIYSSLKQGDSGNIVAEKDGKFGVISPSAQELIPFNYTSITDWGDGRFRLSDGKSFGIYRPANNTWQLQMGKYSALGYKLWKDRAIWVRKGDKWGVVLNDLSREVVPPIYGEKEIFEGFKTTHDNKNFTVHIKKNGTVGVIDYYGKTIIPLGRYNEVVGYSYDYICVKKGNKKGLVNRYTGKQIIPPIHDRIDGIGNGNILALNKTNTGSIGYIYSEDGKLLTKQAYSNSQKYAITNFIVNWLGRYFSEFDFIL